MAGGVNPIWPPSCVRTLVCVFTYVCALVSVHIPMLECACMCICAHMCIRRRRVGSIQKMDQVAPVV